MDAKKSQTTKILLRKNSMSHDASAIESSIFCKYEAIRYVLNGIFATCVHFAVLMFNMQILSLQSAALGNGLASMIGIAVSVAGSRIYVFRKHNCPVVSQAAKFIILYSCIACVHVSILFVWTDVFKFSYVIGFVIATLFQVAISFFGNKLIVFK